MKEKDEKIAQLEKILAETRASQKQSAATIAENYNSRTLSIPKRRLKYFLKISRFKIILVILVFLVIGVGGFWLFQGNTFKRDSATFVEQVQELSTLATAEAHVKTILKEEDNKILGNDISINLPGTKRELLMVVPATVIAGVDLKGVTSKDMIINEEKKEIDITLPHAELIQKPSVQIDKILKIDDSGIFSGDVKGDEWLDLAAEAQKQIGQEAVSEGLLTTADKNAEKVLKEFFKNIGYTVNVTFS
ncbi:DUF4230 domain-containing protein [Rummeliibacillus sp. POC4]|nr:DUF4230 domain-containing protein [Rummeliibacillus sp. POC4]